MEPLEAVQSTADVVAGLSGRFMLDLETYVHGETLGYTGADFYLAGRGGALGEVAASVVAASFVFFNPGYVAAVWERTATVLPRHQAAAEFAAVGHRWGDEHLPDEATAARLAELAGTLAAAASPAGAPMFAAWRSLPEPEPSRPKALAVHHMNSLRELRAALHGAALLTRGVTPHEAVARRTPYMLGIFGWEEPHPEVDPVRAPWKEAQAATDQALTVAYGELTAAERAEFVEVANAVQASLDG